MKRLAILVSAAAAAAVLSSGAMAAKIQLKMQSSEASSDSMYKMEERWVKDVAAMTNGDIQIDLVSAGAVVPIQNMLDAASTGILQMYSADPSFFAGKNPAFAMMGNLVGAWDDPWLAYDFMKFNGGEELYNKLLHPYGVHLIGATFLGVESIVSKKPLEGPESFKGLKFRAPQGMVADVFSQMGASPVNLPGSEVFTSLQKGIIDGADYNSFAVNYNKGLYKIANHTNYPGIHSLPMHSIVMNKKVWDGMPAHLKAIMEVSTYKLNFELIETIKYDNDKFMKQAKDEGADIHIYAWSTEKKAEFRTIAKTTWAKWAEKNEICKEYYTKVIDYMKMRNMIN